MTTLEYCAKEQQLSQEERTTMTPKGSRKWIAALTMACLLATHQPVRGDQLDTLRVGVQPDGRIGVPTNQILKPAGKQILFPGRPVDLAFADEGRTLVVKNRWDLVFIDLTTARVKQTLALPSKKKTDTGFSVVGILVQGGRVYA